MQQGSSAACNRALDAVRAVRTRLMGDSRAVEEQRSNFAPYASNRRIGPTTKVKLWHVKMFCLADKNCTRIPCTPSSRELHIEAGLGFKTFTVPVNSCGEDFRDIILSNFPKLREGGGFEMLRCIPNTKDLDVISPSIANSAKLLKASIGNARVFLRPIQRNLDVNVDNDVVPKCEVRCLVVY